MGFRDYFRDVFCGPKVLIDSTFGKIEGYSLYVHWDGGVFFEPTGDEVGIHLTADEFGPSEVHRELFGQLRERYPAIKREIENIAFDEVKGWFDATIEWERKHPSGSCPKITPLASESEIWDHIRLAVVHIDPRSAEHNVWLAFSLYDNGQEQNDFTRDAEHDLNVMLKDWRIVFCGIEG
jgi:hypothetical protein